MIALYPDVAVDVKSDRVEFFDSFLGGTRIVSKETVRINELNRSDLKESFVSLTVPHKVGTVVKGADKFALTMHPDLGQDFVDGCSTLALTQTVPREYHRYVILQSKLLFSIGK